MYYITKTRSSKIVFLMLFIMAVCIFASEKIVVRFENPDAQTVAKFSSDNFDIASYYPGKYLDLVIDKSTYSDMSKLYPGIKIIKTEDQIKQNLRNDKVTEGYRTYEETLAELQQIEADNPGICKLYNIGKSQGSIYSGSGLSSYYDFSHDIWALKLSDNVDIEDDEPSFYFLGAHHAREPIGTEVVMSILNNIIDDYGTDPEMQRRINNSQIWFVPIVNPDGQKVVLTESDVWWRKNLRDNNNDSLFSFTGDGVDLNRNYGFWWGPNGTSHDPEDDIYNGPEPWSEPEITAVKNLIDSHHFVAGISYHSYSELVLYPFGYDIDAVPPDQNSLSNLAEDIASSIPSQNGFSYYPTQAVNLYPTMGSAEDYSYGEHGIFCFTIELATEFIPPYSEVLTVCNDNLVAANILLDRANSAMLTGIISDNVTKSLVQAQISVKGIDDKDIYKKPYISNEMYGRYYRFLEPGTYEVTFSAYGYIPVTVPGVVITSTGITDLSIPLTPSTITNISGTVTDSSTGNPVVSASIEIFEGISVCTDSNGIYSADNVPYDNYEFTISCSNYKTSYMPVTIDGTSDTFNIQIEQGNLEDFETHDFSRFNWTFGENTDWYISSFSPKKGHFYARSGWMEYDSGTSSLILSDSLDEEGYISFILNMTDVESSDIFRFRIDGNIVKTWSAARWGVESFPVTSGFHIFTWEFNKNSTYGGDHYACVDNITFPRLINTGIENNESPIIKACELYQNYPNPFNPSTLIDFSVKNSGIVKLKIFNVKGELVTNLLNNKIEAGRHKIMFDGRNLNSGLYFMSLEAGNFSTTKPMLLIK